MKEWWLRFVDAVSARRPSDRQLKFLMAAMCRHAWGRLEERGRAAVLRAEAEACAPTYRGPDGASKRVEAVWATGPVEWMTEWLDGEENETAVRMVAYNANWMHKETDDFPEEEANRLLEEVLGPDSATRPAVTRAVTALAAYVEEVRDWAALPVLADLLEDEGCVVGRELLGHLRGPGPHCLGCWAVRMILGR